MATMEEIMLTINAKDNASSVAQQVDGSFKSMASEIQSAMNSLNSGLMNLSTGMNSMLSGLTNGKSAGDIIFGTSSKAETNKVLINMMTETKEAADSLYSTVDSVTDASLTSMQELIPAMNAFKSATGASDAELKNVTDEMANFGAAVLAQTGSTELAQTAMMNLSKGIKGAFASLDQYGVSEDALMRTGLWSGKEDDVEGYMAAIQEVIGSTDELMDTNQGLDALIGKSFSRAGKKIGNEFLPVIKDIKRGFIDLDNELGGGLAASILVVSEGVDVLSQSLFTASTMINGVQDIANAFHKVSDAIKGANTAMETFNNGMNIASNASDVAGMGAGVTGDAIKGASKTEKAVDMGIGGLTAADMLKNNTSEKKDLKKLLKEIEDSSKLQDKINKEMYSLQKFPLAAGDMKIKTANVKPSTSGYIQSLSQSLRESLDGKNIKSIMKENEGAKKEAGKLLKELSPAEFMFDDDTLNMWEKSEMGLTDAIKNHFTGFKNKLTNSISSIKNFSFGETLQNTLKKGFGGVGNIATTISGKFNSIKKSITGIKMDDVVGAIKTPFNKLSTNIKNIKMPDIKGKLSGLNKSLYQSISGFSFTDSFKSLKDKFKGLKDTKEIVDGIDEVGDMAGALGDAAPALGAGATGAEATAAATTTLSGAFTSMIVPALALAAVVAIMIPIVAGIAAEAMIFIKLLGEFMESLHFDNINLSGAIEGLKSIATGLLYVGAAMAAMTFTSIMTGLAIVTSGFMGITTPLKVAKDAIMGAAKELQSFSGINIDPSIAQKIQSVSDSLKAVSDVMGAMTWANITTGFSNWVAGVLGFSSISDGISKAKDEIINASNKLQEFSNITPLPESVAQNIQNVCNSLASVGDAMSALRSIRDGQNWDNIFGELMNGLFGSSLDIGTALNNVKGDIHNAASALSSWTGLPEVPQDIGDKIKKVSDALGNLKSGLESMKSVAQTYDGGFIGWIQGGLFGGSDIQGSIDKAISEINQVAGKLSNIQVVNIPDLSFIQRVSVGLSYLKQSGTQLSQFSGFNISPDVPENVRLAVESVSKVASYLSGVNNINVGDINGLLTTINDALNNIRNTLSNAGGSFSAPAMNIGTQIVSGVQSGLASLGGVVQGSVSSGIASASGVALSGGQNLGNQTTGGFRSTLKLADVMNTEMGYVKTAVDNGISAAKTAAQNGAEDIVEAFKNGINVGSPGDIAKTMKQELIYTKDFILSSIHGLSNASYNVARNIVDSFGNPNLNLSTLLNDSSNRWNMDQLMSMNTLNSQAPPNTTNTNSTTLIFNEGAIPIDARNMTPYEAKQWLILALESLGVDLPIKGM